MDAVDSDPMDQRRVILERAEFSPDPRALRENLEQLDRLLLDSDAWVRRRVRLFFGQLVAQWQSRFAGEPMSVSVELVGRAVRVSTGRAHQTLGEGDWRILVTPSILDLVDAWGFDRRYEGHAWFEFHEGRAGQPGG